MGTLLFASKDLECGLLFTFINLSYNFKNIFIDIYLIPLDRVYLQPGPLCAACLSNTTHVHLLQEELNDTCMRSSYCVFYCHGFSLRVSSVYFVPFVILPYSKQL